MSDLCPMAYSQSPGFSSQAGHPREGQAAGASQLSACTAGQGDDHTRFTLGCDVSHILPGTARPKPNTCQGPGRHSQGFWAQGV